MHDVCRWLWKSPPHLRNPPNNLKNEVLGSRIASRLPISTVLRHVTEPRQQYLTFRVSMSRWTNNPIFLRLRPWSHIQLRCLHSTLGRVREQGRSFSTRGRVTIGAGLSRLSVHLFPAACSSRIWTGALQILTPVGGLEYNTATCTPLKCR